MQNKRKLHKHLIFTCFLDFIVPDSGFRLHTIPPPHS